MIAVLDYDVGNVGAVANMLRRLGHVCEITADAEVIKRASKLVLPGNGAFDACMRNLDASGLRPVLERRVLEERVPLLGICVGAQMLVAPARKASEPGSVGSTCKSAGFLRYLVCACRTWDGTRCAE